MKKPKIYLDTSVISHLKQDDAPEKVAETHKLWLDVKAGKYDVYLSDSLRKSVGANPISSIMCWIALTILNTLL